MKMNASHMKVIWSGGDDTGVFTRYDKCKNSDTSISDQKLNEHINTKLYNDN
jgi:hypothetical protein